MKTRPKCPKCGDENIAEILYGLPAFDKSLERGLESGKVVLGGYEDGTKR